MAKKIRPAPGRVLVKAPARETLTKGGLHIPEIAESERDSPVYAEVLALGYWQVPKETIDLIGQLRDHGDGGKAVAEKAAAAAVCFNVGDLVVIHRFSGTRVVLDGEEYLIMPREDILGVIEQ